jgi:carboxyl-terminal processing protease
VARIQPGSPADRAGIAVGDRILTIDGEHVAGEPVTEVVARLRGEEPVGERALATGAPVVLCLERGGRIWRETLRRARLSAHPVTTDRSAADHATRIRVESFTKGVGEKVRRAVRQAPPGDGILLDLRGNSGGLVTEAVTAASAFLDGGLVATYDIQGEQRALYAKEGGDKRSLVVLVDGGTMSAAELLAGALQDRGRAVIVGSRTFGKGSVQMPSELPDGSVAELTVGHYRTPAGRTVDGEGITPDLPVRSGAEERARRVLSGLGGRA